MTLADFLLARYDEREERARSVTSGDTPIEPVAVLADLAAKRAIVALHPLHEGWAYRDTLCCARCTARGEYPADDAGTDEQNWPCPTLRALAREFADHPDYDEAWS